MKRTKEIAIMLHGIPMTSEVYAEEYPPRISLEISMQLRCQVRDTFFINLPDRVEVAHVKEGFYHGPVETTEKSKNNKK